MIINQANLANVYVGLSTAFNAAFQTLPAPWYEKLAMTVPSTGRSIDYKFILDYPGMREWIGDRVIRSLEGKRWIVENKDYEITIGVERNDIEDDQLGLYSPLVAQLAMEAKFHPNQLIRDLISAGGATVCYDGQYFFDTDHPVGTGTASNFDAGAATPWYLFDNTRPVKPFIFQLRQAVELTRMDKDDDEHVFMRKQFRFGVDGRYAAAYGLWQLAYKSTQNLTGTYYGNARAAMRNFVNADGRPLDVQPSLLVVPPSLEETARNLLNADIVLGDPTAGGSKTNVWKGSADLLVVPGLT
jgi:phage major head subunit gpT-like protein